MAGPTPAQVLREFGTLRGPSPEQVEREFGVRAATEEPLPEPLEFPATAPGMGGATVNTPTTDFPVGLGGATGEGYPGLERSDMRMLTEGGAAAAGETIGQRFGGKIGGYAGAFGGGALGSLLSNLFDPVENPITEALQTGAFEATLKGGAEAAIVGIRRAVGDPNKAAKWLIAREEKFGGLPPAGALFPESSLVTNAQSIAQADIVFGHRVQRALARTEGKITDELRQWLDGYLRYRNTASVKFSKVDSIIEQTVGSKGVVELPEHVWDATRDLVKGWKARGLHQSDAMIAKLVEKVELAEARLAQQGGVKFAPPELSFREADALGDRFYEAARAADKGTVAQQQALAGVDYGQAYRQFARDVDSAFDAAVDRQIKTGQLPLETKAELQGARQLWKRWKSGEVMRDNIMDKLDDAARRDGPIDSGTLFSSINAIRASVDSRKVTPLQVKHLTNIAQALQQVERAGGQKAFTWTVRAGQLGILVGGPSVLEGAARGAMFITLVPSTLNWLTTSPQAVKWMVEGMKTEGATANARRLARNLIGAMVKEGLFSPDRMPPGGMDPESVPTPSPEFRMRTDPASQNTRGRINATFPKLPATRIIPGQPSGAQPPRG